MDYINFKMGIKLVAIDLDGTLLNSKGLVRQRNITIIKKVIEKDVKIVLCTGRNIKEANIIAKLIGYNATMVIGDNDNDISMFHEAGVSVAMGNAIDQVKNLQIL